MLTRTRTRTRTQVIKTPECVRVYIGSFWESPLQCNEWSKQLLQAEMRDLLTDLKNIPKNAAIRKVNELVKRVRLAKAHMCIVGHLKKEMPAVFGKEKTQAKLLGSLEDHFLKVHRTHRPRTCMHTHPTTHPHARPHLHPRRCTVRTSCPSETSRT